MSRNRSDDPGEPAVKVIDRRRFRPDGEAVEGAGGSEAEARGGPPAGGTAGSPATATLDMEKKLEAQAARIDELSRAYAALLEDNKGFRARLERERDRVVEAERARVAQALLEAADELEMAVAADPEGEDPLHRGVKLVLAGLQRRIGELGAVRLDVTGRPFDPRLAEAVDVVEVTEAGQDGLVVAELRAGWRIGDRVLRPARVRVARLRPPADSPAPVPGRE
ncbi:MAG TPA: nucleotide exchange factor GrpE [Anaeromyxobacteraceae bacterium]|nr:nucleotide exchange factor GrpE [Anaeromyxobacteraceae bacterium]